MRIWHLFDPVLRFDLVTPNRDPSLGVGSMFAAIPATKPAGSQADSIAERGEAATIGAEVQQRPVQLFYSPAPSGARLVKPGLAIGQWDDASALWGDCISGSNAKRRRLSGRLRRSKASARHLVSVTVSGAVSLKNEAGQGFKAYCLGHCLAGVSLRDASVSVSYAIVCETVRQAYNNGSVIEQPLLFGLCL
jgi:hypothetical protein